MIDKFEKKNGRGEKFYTYNKRQTSSYFQRAKEKGEDSFPNCNGYQLLSTANNRDKRGGIGEQRLSRIISRRKKKGKRVSRETSK